MDMITSFWKPSRKHRKNSIQNDNIKGNEKRSFSDVANIFRKPPQRSQSLRLTSTSKSGARKPLSNAVRNAMIAGEHNSSGSTFSYESGNNNNNNNNNNNRLLLTDQNLIVHISGGDSAENGTGNGNYKNNQNTIKRILVTQRPGGNHSYSLNDYRPVSSSETDRSQHECRPSNSPLLGGKTPFSDSYLEQNSSMTLSKYEFIKRQQNAGVDGNSHSAEQLPQFKGCASNSSKNCSDGSDIDCSKSGSYGSVGDDEGINLVSCNDDCPEELESSEDDYDFDFDDTDDSTKDCDPIGTRKIFLTRPPSCPENGSRPGLGLFIQGGSEFGLPIIVSSIRPSSPADNIGSIFIGDFILSVNGVPIDESTTHADACRLLAECGDSVCLVLRHSRCSNQMKRRRWRGLRSELSHQKLQCSRSTPATAAGHHTSSGIILPNSGNLPSNSFTNKSQSTVIEDVPGVIQPLPPYAGNHLINQRSCSASCLTQYYQIDLFLANVSRFISYSDQRRHASLELRYSSPDTGNGNEPLIIQCNTEELACEWFESIAKCIETQIESFVSFYNSHFPRDEHIHFMGWLAERIPFETKAFELQKSLKWSSKFGIIKSGRLFLFKASPNDIIRDVKHYLNQLMTSNRSPTSVSNSTASAASSLVSVGSNDIDPEQNSRSSSNKKIVHSKNELKSFKINSAFNKQLHEQAEAVFECYKCDFEVVKVCKDFRKNCFVVYNGAGQASSHYFSCELAAKTQQFEKAWFRANFDSVLKHKCKTFTVQLEKDNIFGSFNIDWHRGLSFYDPKTKQHLWSFQFEQIKYIEEDGSTLLLLTFAIPNCHKTVTNILRCSNLMSVVYCINAFLTAKLYAVNNFDFCK